MIFVIGREGRFDVGSEVVVRPACVGRNPFTDKEVPISASVTILKGHYGAPLKRGVVQEASGFYARVLPRDAEEGLSELDLRIEAKRDELQALHRERQAFLAANVVRGEKIREKHATSKSAEEG